ncbi:MAG: hypothetical protein WC472_02165 [Candidatus Paceibacterota bacterium]
MAYAKIIISGKSIDYYRFQLEPPLLGTPRNVDKDKKKEKIEADPNNSLYRTKRIINELINCNAWEWHKKNGRPYPPYFLTLTFKENIQDLKEANREFSKFIQRYNYELFGEKKARLKYLGVPEFQKRGAIHYHVIIFNLPYKKKRVYRTLFKLWGKGRVELKIVVTMKSLINYLSKYLTKDLLDNKLSNKKRYFCSRNLKKPVVIKDFGFAERVIKNIDKSRIVFQKNYYNEYLGEAQHIIYSMRKDEDILDLELDWGDKNHLESLINKENEKELWNI